MDELKAALSKALADTTLLYFKAHSFHWNVVGPNFPQYHDFLNNFYEEVYGAIDALAENIRMLDGMAPVSLSQLIIMSSIAEENAVRTVPEIFSILQSNNQKVIISLMQAYQKAEAQTELGVSNFLQDRIAAHQKHGWMLKAILS
jgi:starvation-inducible DNA-binding protein